MLWPSEFKKLRNDRSTHNLNPIETKVIRLWKRLCCRASLLFLYGVAWLQMVVLNYKLWAGYISILFNLMVLRSIQNTELYISIDVHVECTWNECCNCEISILKRNIVGAVLALSPQGVCARMPCMHTCADVGWWRPRGTHAFVEFGGVEIQLQNPLFSSPSGSLCRIIRLGRPSRHRRPKSLRLVARVSGWTDF